MTEAMVRHLQIDPSTRPDAKSQFRPVYDRWGLRLQLWIYPQPLRVVVRDDNGRAQSLV